MALRVRHGVAPELEALADELLAASLEGVTSRVEKSDILTPWKQKHRETHEILTRTGHPVDGQIRRGMFHRAYNRQQTHLNSYLGATKGMRMDSSWDPDMVEPTNFLSSQMSAVFGVARND